jgi:hypothetical protein
MTQKWLGEGTVSRVALSFDGEHVIKKVKSAIGQRGRGGMRISDQERAEIAERTAKYTALLAENAFGLISGFPNTRLVVPLVNVARPACSFKSA